MPEAKTQDRLRRLLQTIVAVSTALSFSGQSWAVAENAASRLSDAVPGAVLVPGVAVSVRLAPTKRASGASMSAAQVSALQTGVGSYDAENIIVPADGSVAYEEEGTLSQQLELPLYHWWQPGTTPRGAVIAVHGLVMHGRSFDALGRTLAARGFDVYAVDMRGYGRSLAEDHRYCSSVSDCKHRIDYDRSNDDLIALCKALRNQSPRTPIFAAGESLGGAMVIRLAGKNPDLVDGLILSAPAIKRHNFVDPYLVATAAFVATNPMAQLDLMPFVRKFSSDDQRVIDEKEIDPLLRRRMSALELVRSSNAVRKTMSFIPGISADTPVLVIQGSADRCIKADGVMRLLANLRSDDQTVKWFHQRGHILLETSFVKPDTMEAVVSWLTTHVDSGMVQAKLQRRFPGLAAKPSGALPTISVDLALPRQSQMVLKTDSLQTVGLR